MQSCVLLSKPVKFSQLVNFFFFSIAFVLIFLLCFHEITLLEIRCWRKNLKTGTNPYFRPYTTRAVISRGDISRGVSPHINLPNCHLSLWHPVSPTIAPSRTMATPLAPPSECWRCRYCRCPWPRPGLLQRSIIPTPSFAAVLWARMRARFRQQQRASHTPSAGQTISIAMCWWFRCY